MQFHPRTQLIDALIAFGHHLDLFKGFINGQGLLTKAAVIAGFLGFDFPLLRYRNRDKTSRYTPGQ
jgi:hypothetical protein